ncbi:hypothetical protein PNEG_00820 [Pneumocystis murina B123]|uniref:ubiquitinyl hydrolase 1 n=1 Tax=Pneumocystis murina (strain B123) TaxID=1069680 RepID=M7NVS1_PNEMU|nr:hypothetical protein PNEG_00820 [Pneumocystis murina B123]EMR11231.1 hypothetical protein PNEG_00820 [Pneumocystis murina B123]
MTCSHLLQIHTPDAIQNIYSRECTQCFDSWDNLLGIDVCLFCFNAGCLDKQRHHALTHFERTQHPLVVNIRRITKNMDQRNKSLQKQRKLVIEEKIEAYDIQTCVKCYSCKISDICDESGHLKNVIDSILSSPSSIQKNEMKSWEQEITCCEHAFSLFQDERVNDYRLFSSCIQCDLKENLWLCLQCGNVGCGRRQNIGIEGNGHALLHFEKTSHPISVKLGTITPEGTVDIYCYLCNDEVLDPDLPAHLKHWGIDINEHEKVEKNLIELQLEQNMKWDFVSFDSNSKNEKLLSGPGLVGLKNFGNTCYLSSVLQVIFSFKVFQERYMSSFQEHPLHCKFSSPSLCLECQLNKIADGLISGRYSTSTENMNSLERIRYENAITPSMFKMLVGKDHPEFSTMKQQDSFEFLLHLSKLISQKSRASNLYDPTTVFRFRIEQRLQCLSCKCVRYSSHDQDNISLSFPTKNDSDDESILKEITLEECLDLYTSDESIVYFCKSCGEKGNANRRNLFSTFPEIFVINIQRFELVNWVPRKLDVSIIFPEDKINLDKYLFEGIPSNENVLFDDQKNSLSNEPLINMEYCKQLHSMGFTWAQSKKALIETENSGVEAAMLWILSNRDSLNDDNTFESVFPKIDDKQIKILEDMGFTSSQARKALKETDSNTERAIEWLFSHPDDNINDFEINKNGMTGLNKLPATYKCQAIICHKGGSVHAGHYVAFIKKHIFDKEEWILFNDEKVSQVNDINEAHKTSYIYFFQRI